MNKYLTSTVAALVAVGSVVTAIPAQAQYRNRDSDRDGVPDRREWNRDRDRDGRPDQYDRRDNRRDNRRDRHTWRYYGGNYGYNGYQGRWRTGQRYPYWRDRGYYITNYSYYGLPAPRPGYRYYRADNGDIVMAAVATGLIGLIIGGALR
ncbi:RcnB family protein [Novosphingobium flavum]|uniref:RcnB family protein n=1 Tax=Novosphingobium flavum TaxID=1778672 RepID=A0A7X1KKN4_9SPHN|nr:RcnB family protein [Novosphingobium flavum]MBC2664739.1 RcnB family protein [Novosphingobium flavum]